MSYTSVNPASLDRRSYGIPILELLGCEDQLTFGSLMERLNISKKGLFLTLKDLEIDELIVREKKGRQTYVTLTPKGKQVLLQHSIRKQEAGSLIDQIVNETISLLEKEGSLSKQISTDHRKEFINKLKLSVAEQLSSKSVNEERSD